MSQNIFDIAVAATLLFFAIRGVWNGFIEEVAGIAALVGGFWAARAWSPGLAPRLSFISDPGLRPLAASVAVFVCVLIGAGLLARILKRVFSFSFLAWLDKLAGFFLGLAKGVLVWALIIVVLDKVMPDAEFIRESRAIPYFSGVVDQIRAWLPASLGGAA